MGEPLYRGRIVAIGKTELGHNVGLYRVSSRSFPNREIIEHEERLIVIPRKGFEQEALVNPYVAYTAIKKAGAFLVISNGFHTELIADKIEEGVSPQYAIGSVLGMIGYERDGHNTPRIAGVVPLAGHTGWLGAAKFGDLVVREIDLGAGYINYVATNYQTEPSPVCIFEAHPVDQIGRFLIEDRLFFRTLEHPVASAAAVFDGKKLHFSTYSV